MLLSRWETRNGERQQPEPGQALEPVAGAGIADSINSTSMSPDTNGSHPFLGYELSCSDDASWPRRCDAQAQEGGYFPAHEALRLLRRKERRPAHDDGMTNTDDLVGLVDFGIVLWVGDRITEVNARPIVAKHPIRIAGEADNGFTGWFLDDSVLVFSRINIWKSDESAGKADSWVDGTCGFQIDPDTAWLIPYTDMQSVAMDDGHHDVRFFLPPRADALIDCLSERQPLISWLRHRVAPQSNDDAERLFLLLTGKRP